MMETEDKLPGAEGVAAETSKWHHWCRLCAKQDESNMNVYYKEGEDCWTSVLAVAIGKYFWVNIKMDDELSNFLCRDCYTLMEALISFSERVNRVQSLFSMLGEAVSASGLDYEDLRIKCGLQEEDWKLKISTLASDMKPVVVDIKPSLEPSDYDEDAEILAEIEGEELLDGDGSTYGTYSVHDDEEAIEKVESTDGKESSDFKALMDYEMQMESMSSTEAANIVIEEDADDQSCGKYKCAMCQKYYKKPMAYKRHMEEAHGTVPVDLPNLECKRCNRMFPTQNQLTVHFRSHLPSKDKADYSCNFCDKMFTTSGALKRHIAGTHDKLKPFVCDCCGKALKSNTALMEHKLVHTDECPYECTVCQRRFKNKARLKIHAEIHNDQSYECDICGLKLNTRRTFNMHKLVHSDVKDYKCDVCGAAFKRGKTLKSHLILHTGIRPYKCNFCGKDFSNGSNCRMHKRKSHPKELAAEESSGVVRATILPMLTELTAASKEIRSTMVLTAEEHVIESASQKTVMQRQLNKGVEIEADSDTEVDNGLFDDFVEEIECS